MRFYEPAIYLTTYKNRRYVGKTIGRGNDYYGSGRLIQNIIKSGSKDKLKVKLLETVKDVSKLDEKEIYWIAKLKPEMNIAPGGEGGDRSMAFTKEGAKSKSIKMSNMKRSKEWCDNIRKAKLGIKLSDYQRQKISESHKGKVLSEKHKKSISKGSSNRTVEYKKNMSKIIKLAWAKRKGEVS